MGCYLPQNKALRCDGDGAVENDGGHLPLFLLHFSQGSALMLSQQQEEKQDKPVTTPTLST